LWRRNDHIGREVRMNCVEYVFGTHDRVCGWERRCWMYKVVVNASSTLIPVEATPATPARKKGIFDQGPIDSKVRAEIRVSFWSLILRRK